MADSGEISMSWLRPVGLVVQALSASRPAVTSSAAPGRAAP
jgi:hypothetical protein